jgi:hypothetical protein
VVGTISTGGYYVPRGLERFRPGDSWGHGGFLIFMRKRHDSEFDSELASDIIVNRRQPVKMVDF